MFPLSPVGFNFGIPPTNKPPSDMGPPLLELLLLLIALELLVLLLVLLNEELVDSPLTFPAKRMFLVSSQFFITIALYTFAFEFNSLCDICLTSSSILIIYQR